MKTKAHSRQARNESVEQFEEELGLKAMCVARARKRLNSTTTINIQQELQCSC